MYPIGTQFLRLHFNSYAVVKKITTHTVKEGKKTKLSDPILLIEYDKQVTLTETKKTQVEMKESDVKSQIDNGLWKLG